MRLVMMGTGPFAVPTFRLLFDTHHQVVLLVTAPLRRHRGERIAPVSPIRDIAHEHGVPVFDPEDVNTAEAQETLAGRAADLLVVCDYGQILSSATLATAALGGINLHASLLPRYRGAAPINWALYQGESHTGVTVIHMTPRVDAGPCVGQVRTAIEPSEDAVQLEARLAEMGAWLVRRTIDAMEAGRLELLPQDPAQASRAPRLKKSDGEIDWRRSAQALFDQVRALEPWPKTYTYLHAGNETPQRWILGRVEVAEATAPSAAPSAAPPGAIVAADAAGLLVQTGAGLLRIKTLQPSGKRAMNVEEFLRGHAIEPGQRLGPEQLRWPADAAT